MRLNTITSVGEGWSAIRVAGVPLYHTVGLCPWFQNGWVRLKIFDSPPAQVVSEIIFKDGPRNTDRILSVTSLPTMVPSKQFLAPAIKASEVQSAYAIVNPSRSDTATVTLKIIDTRGNLLCSDTLTLPPLNRIRKFLDELSSPCASSTLSRTIRIISDIPIAVAAVKVFLPEGSFVNLPVQPLN